MRYLPQTSDEIAQMCQSLGIANPDQLFEVIPEALRRRQPLDLPKPLSELELLAHFQKMTATQETTASFSSFLGGGAYHHYIPSAVGAITSRGEFLSAYTPYQPEISQGTLQAIFEFQTMIASLTGMDLANASNYDGASALAEAVLMALRVTKRRKVLVSAAIHPDYRQVVRTYLSNTDCELKEIPCREDGRVDAAVLASECSAEVAAVCVQSPNAFGVVEDLVSLEKTPHAEGALLIAAFSEALSLGFLQAPGKLGADIVVGEGQSFGNALNFGGPYLGLFATREKFARQMPGRLVGETVDAEGKRGFVLALSTREQHIRREKATSNICTNQGLCALTTAIYLSLLGPVGLEKLAKMNYAHARYLREGLQKIPGVALRFSGTSFNEFVLKLPRATEAVLRDLRQAKILGGIDVSTWGPGLENCLLVCATELNDREQLDRYLQTMKEVL